MKGRLMCVSEIKTILNERLRLHNAKLYSNVRSDWQRWTCYK